MPIPHVEFDPEKHIYRLDGVIIPSVSEIIAPLYDHSGIPAKHLENARERGLAVDIACQFDDEGDLDEGSLDPETASYVEGWRKFRREWEFKPLLIQKPMSHAIHGMAYGMTPDRIGHGKMAEGEIVVDIKCTAAVERPQRIQLAGYAAPFDGPRFVVQLFPKNYKLHDFAKTAKRDDGMFVCCLSMNYWKRGRD